MNNGANYDEEKKTERFVCIFCAFFYYTKDYSDPKPFRDGYDAISSRCPRCGCVSDKPIEKMKPH